MKRMLILLGLVFCLTACGEVSSQVPENVVTPQPDQNQAMAANDALLEAYGWDGSSETVDVMPRDYAGRYIDEDNVLNILTVAPPADVLETYTEACGTQNIRLQAAEFSYYDLNEAMDALNEYNSTHDPKLCYSWGIDEMENRINILVSLKMEEEAKKLQEQYPCISYEIYDETQASEPADHSMYTEIAEVTLELVEQTEEKVAFRLVNNSDMEVFFGSTNTLDVLVDGAWCSLPYREDIAFTEELRVAAPGGTCESSEWLPARSYEIVPGTYRIGQIYALGEYAPLQGKDFDHIAYLIFEISE